MNINKQEIEQYIRTFRLNNCWSQLQMAQYLKVSQPMVSMMEGGNYVWTPLTLAKLKKKLPGLPVEETNA